MPSSPLAAGLCPLDFGHLERMTLGEKALEREVLEMFVAQSSRLLEALAAPPAEAGALAHTLKGSARAIGAFKVADRAAALEEAAGQGSDDAEALVALREAVAEARATIEERLGRS
jgi:HPt (histidine-containing phosphotransfer) domain-containing protein